MIKCKYLNLKLLFFLPILAINIYGQDSNDFNVRLKFHPSAFVALSRLTFLGSVEFNYKRVGVDIAYGQQWAFICSSHPDTLRVKNFGNQYRADLKYYFKPLEKNNQTTPFISIGYAKLYTQTNITVDWFSGFEFIPALATINNIHVYYIYCGISSLSGRIVTEGAIGTGVSFRTEESVYANKIVYEKESWTRLHLSLSLKIGYILSYKSKGQDKH